MTSAAQKLLEEAKHLSHDERVELVEALSDTFSDERASLSPEWTAEVTNRIAQLESGEVRAVPWSEVQARLDRTLGRG